MKYAWHFVKETLRDGRPIPEDGAWLEHSGSLELCKSGLHASKKLINALHYSPGLTLCRVAMDGIIKEDTDKMVASRRKILWRIDAESLLHAFARWCAIQVVDNWDAPPVVLHFLRTGEGRNAAWTAAWTAVNSDVNSAAWSAVNSAAWSAAWSAVNSAAWSAAAWSAVWNNAVNAILEEFVREARDGYTEWELTF